MFFYNNYYLVSELYRDLLTFPTPTLTLITESIPIEIRDRWKKNDNY